MNGDRRMTRGRLSTSGSGGDAGRMGVGVGPRPRCLQVVGQSPRWRQMTIIMINHGVRIRSRSDTFRLIFTRRIVSISAGHAGASNSSGRMQ